MRKKYATNSDGVTLKNPEQYLRDLGETVLSEHDYRVFIAAYKCREKGGRVWPSKVAGYLGVPFSKTSIIVKIFRRLADAGMMRRDISRDGKAPYVRWYVIVMA